MEKASATRNLHAVKNRLHLDAGLQTERREQQQTQSQVIIGVIFPVQGHFNSIHVNYSQHQRREIKTLAAGLNYLKAGGSNLDTGRCKSVGRAKPKTWCQFPHHSSSVHGQYMKFVALSSRNLDLISQLSTGRGDVGGLICSKIWKIIWNQEIHIGGWLNQEFRDIWERLYNKK